MMEAQVWQFYSIIRSVFVRLVLGDVALMGNRKVSKILLWFQRELRAIS